MLPVRIVFNRLLAAGSKSGIGHYAAELFQALQQHAPGAEVVPFPHGWLWHAQTLGARLRPLSETRRQGDKETRRQEEGERGSSVSRSPGLLVSLSPKCLLNWRSRLFASLREYGQRWLEGSFRSLCSRQHFDLYHEPNYIPLPGDVPAIATVHDLSLLLHPQWHPLDRVRHFERRFQAGLERCIHLLTDSESVRQEMLAHLGLRPDQVTAIPLGLRPGFRPLPRDEVQRGLRRLKLPDRYLLYLGTLEPRKNVLLLLQVYCSLPAELRRRWPLLLVGGWGWHRAEIAAFLDAEARHKGVIHLGYLPDRHLPLLYNGAPALVFPSHYEGFGFPPLEMLACGGAVLASTASALVELVGKKAHLVDADDSDGWREALLRVLTDDDWQQALRHGAEETARPYTWQRCAARTLEVYQSSLGLLNGAKAG